jgi:predicted Zn-dependent protease
MNMNEAGHHLSSLLSKYKVDYLEAHLEESQSSHLTYRGKVLESVDKTNAVGGNVRALEKGGWGFVSFNSLDDLKSKIEQAIEQARFVSGGDAKVIRIKPIVDIVKDEVKQNPVDIALSGVLLNFKLRSLDIAIATANTCILIQKEVTLSRNGQTSHYIQPLLQPMPVKSSR